jgi:hypothetical protein
MTEFIQIPLSENVTDEFYNQVDLFRVRFSELWGNWESLKNLGIELGGSFQNKGNGKVGGSSCGVDIYRLKGFYLDFRFFYANDEPTNYFKIAKTINKLCSDDRARKYLLANKAGWQDAGVLQEWHGYNADKMLNVMFNGKLFHSGQDLQENLSILQESMSDELVHHLLTFYIYNRMLVIRNMYWILKPLSKNNQCIQIPASLT